MARAKYQFLPDLSEDDIRLLDRVSEWIMAADEKYITKFSAFLDERQCLLCEKLMASVKYENYRLWGGYENAARRMLCVYPEYGEAESEDYPITAITLLYRKEDKITHRDILSFLLNMYTAVIALLELHSCSADLRQGACNLACHRRTQEHR